MSDEDHPLTVICWIIAFYLGLIDIGLALL